jgi:replicative superfamily II helicase
MGLLLCRYVQYADRDLCEQLFRARTITVLCCTSTLAMAG